MRNVGVHKAGGEFPCYLKFGRLIDVYSMRTVLGENVEVPLEEVHRRLTTCQLPDEVVQKESRLS